MEPIESSETSAYINTLTPGTYPKEKKLQPVNMYTVFERSADHFNVIKYFKSPRTRGAIIQGAKSLGLLNFVRDIKYFYVINT